MNVTKSLVAVKYVFMQTVYMHCCYYGLKTMNKFKIRMEHSSNKHSGNQKIQSAWNTLQWMGKNTHTRSMDKLQLKPCVLIMTHILTYLMRNVHDFFARIYLHRIFLMKRKCHLDLWHTSSIMFLNQNLAQCLWFTYTKWFFKKYDIFDTQASN